MTHSDPWIVGLLFTIAINVAEMNLRAQKAPWPWVFAFVGVFITVIAFAFAMK